MESGNKVHRLRRSWDSYLVMGPEAVLALSIEDKGAVSVDGAAVIDLRTGVQTARRFRRLGGSALPRDPWRGNVAVAGRGYGILFHADGKNRTLTVHVDRFRGEADLDAHLILTDEPAQRGEDPADRAAGLQRIDCIRAAGAARLGKQEYRFREEDSFAALDWGRRVEGRSGGRCRVWVPALLEGGAMGLSLDCGPGGSPSAAGNRLFYGGRAHELGEVEISLSGGISDPWTFTGPRVALTMTPAVDRTVQAAGGGPGRQVFGRFSGRVALDDGSALELRELMGMAQGEGRIW